MALIKCEECGKEISDQAASCPNCGYKQNQLEEKKVNLSKNKKLLLGIGMVISLIVLVVALTNGRKPSGMSTEVFNLGINTLNIVDEYLDGAILSSEADTKLESVKKRLDKIYDLNSDTNALLISSSTLNLEIQISSMDRMFSKVTDKDIVESRNNLAADLNQRKR